MKKIAILFLVMLVCFPHLNSETATYVPPREQLINLLELAQKGTMRIGINDYHFSLTNKAGVNILAPTLNALQQSLSKREEPLLLRLALIDWNNPWNRLYAGLAVSCIVAAGYHFIKYASYKGTLRALEDHEARTQRKNQQAQQGNTAAEA